MSPPTNKPTPPTYAVKLSLQDWNNACRINKLAIDTLHSIRGIGVAQAKKKETALDFLYGFSLIKPVSLAPPLKTNVLKAMAVPLVEWNHLHFLLGLASGSVLSLSIIAADKVQAERMKKIAIKIEFDFQKIKSATTNIYD